MMRPKHPFANQVNLVPIFGKKSPELNSGDFLRFVFKNYFWLSATATATATVALTMGLLPIEGSLFFAFLLPKTVALLRKFHPIFHK